MNKLWAIIAYEYRRHVLRKRFLIALLSVPLWIVVMVGVSLLAVILTTNKGPVGYIDPGGFLSQAPEDALNASTIFDVSFEAYSDEVTAKNDLENGRIQAYFVLPANYPQTRDVSLVYKDEPDSSIISQFRSVLRNTLLASQPADLVDRVIDGPNLKVVATEQDNQVQNDSWTKVALPIVAAILLVASVFTSSGYLMQAVVEEKENRTMEILATSVSPGNIMSGKIIALICVGLTQVLAWSLPPILAIWLASAYLPFLQNISIDMGQVGLMLLMVLPTFVLIASLMAAIGATVTEAREGQQVSGLVTIPVMVPFMLMAVLINSPGSPFALFLSFFPLTSALTMLLRMAFSTVPPWQVWLSAAILLISGIGGLWLAGRVFRLGMLRYGQRMGWKDVFRALRRPA